MQTRKSFLWKICFSSAPKRYFHASRTEKLYNFCFHRTKHAVDLLSFGSATITCFDGVAGSGISEIVLRLRIMLSEGNCVSHHKLLWNLQSLQVSSLICIGSCQSLRLTSSLSSTSCALWDQKIDLKMTKRFLGNSNSPIRVFIVVNDVLFAGQNHHWNESIAD